MIRISHPRSSTGCTNCKKKSVKCDEAKPICGRCQKFNLTQCTPSAKSEKQSDSGTFHTFSIRVDESPSRRAGVFVPKAVRTLLDDEASKKLKIPHYRDQKILTKPRGFLDPTIANCQKVTLESTQQLTQAIIRGSKSIHFQTPGNWHERRLFHYFRQEILGNLCGYSSVDFWNRSILCLGHENSAIQHAVLSFASCHMNSTTSEISKSEQDTQDAISLRYYNKAVREVQKLLESGKHAPLHVVLSCCVLFYCIEMARGDLDTAMRHATSGLSIMKDPSLGFSSADGDLKEAGASYAGLFASLALHHQHMCSSTSHFLVFTTADERSGAKPCFSPFTTLEQASGAINKMMNWSFQMARTALQYGSRIPDDLPPLMQQEVCTLLEELGRWEISFMKFKDQKLSSVPLEKSDSIPLIGMHLYYLVCKVIVRKVFASEVTRRFGIRRDPIFKEMLPLIRALTKSKDPVASVDDKEGSSSFIKNVLVSVITITLDSREFVVDLEELVLAYSPPTAGCNFEMPQLARMALSIMEDSGDQFEEIFTGGYRAGDEFGEGCGRVWRMLQAQCPLRKRLGLYHYHRRSLI